MRFLKYIGGGWYTSDDFTYEIKRYGTGKWEVYNLREVVPIFMDGRAIGETKKYIGRSDTLRVAKELCEIDAKVNRE